MKKLWLKTFTGVLTIPLLLATSCPDKKASEYPRSIIGTWILITNDVNYPSITFNSDSSAIFSSRGDTIYAYSYFVHNRHVILKDVYNERYMAGIILLTSDSLVLDHMPGKKEPQRHYRQ